MGFLFVLGWVLALPVVGGAGNVPGRPVPLQFEFVWPSIVWPAFARTVLSHSSCSCVVTVVNIQMMMRVVVALFMCKS